jgi:hypothetical protein
MFEKQSLLPQQFGQSRCSTTRLIIPELIPNIPGTNQEEPSVVQLELVSGSPLLKIAPYADPILSSAFLARHCQADLMWPIQRRLLTRQSTALNVLFPFFLLNIFPH